MPARSVQIHNAHPRLHVPRAAVRRAVRLLDTQFALLPGDLPQLSLPRERLRALRSKIETAKAKGVSRRSAASAPRSPLPAHASFLPPGELAVVFMTDDAIAKIHADFMNDPTATDVITFEGTPAALTAATPNGNFAANDAALEAGEICISADTAANYAKAHRRDFATELTLYVVHGWLHLCGYDDLQPAKKRRMRAAEKRAMALLAAEKAIPPFTLRSGRTS